MTSKLKELMELNNAVDVIIKQVDKEDAVKDEKIKANMRERWNKMWDDLDDILPAVEILRQKCTFAYSDQIGYEYGYPYGWKATGANRIYFILSTYSTRVYMDKSGGWEETDRDCFDHWMRAYRPCVEELLKNWDRVYKEMVNDIERRVAENIRKKIKDCKDKTETLDRKLKTY